MGVLTRYFFKKITEVLSISPCYFILNVAGHKVMHIKSNYSSIKNVKNIEVLQKKEETLNANLRV